MIVNDKVLKECVKKLRGFIEDDSGLNCPLEYEFLVKFIRARKYDPELAFQTLTRYYEMRRIYRKDFHDFHPSALRPTLASGIYSILKHRDPYGRKILIFRAELWDPSKISVNEIFLTALLLGEEMILSKETQENGTVMIHDLKGLGLGHARQFSLKQMKKFIAVLQGAFPAKFKTIHVLNQPYIHNVLFAIAQPFLSKKFLSRVALHGSGLEKLHEAIPPQILPSSLGGDLSEDEAEDLAIVQRLFEKQDAYKNMLEYGYASS